MDLSITIINGGMTTLARHQSQLSDWAQGPAMHPGDVKNWNDHWAQSLTSGEFFQIQYRLKRASDETYRWHLGRVVAIRNGDGEIVRWFGTATDIEDQKRAENEIRVLNETLEQRVIERTLQLQTANKELEAFSYSVSHDLRAPLRAINGFAGIVLQDFSAQLPEKGRHYLERIREGGKRMGVLIDDLLAFSRLSRQPINRKTVDTNRVVRNALEELEPSRSGREIKLAIGEIALV